MCSSKFLSVTNLIKVGSMLLYRIMFVCYMASTCVALIIVAMSLFHLYNFWTKVNIHFSAHPFHDQNMFNIVMSFLCVQQLLYS